MYFPDDNEHKLSLIKLAITRILAAVGIWTLFFMAYHQNYTEPLKSQPIILGLLGCYIILEIILLIVDLRQKYEDETSQFIKFLEKSKQDSE